MPDDAGPQQPLARLLLIAARWFDARSLDELERQGWPRLSPAQSTVFAHLDTRGIAPVELARRLGRSRQATHELIQGLVRLGVVAVHDDPGRSGRTRVCLTEAGLRLSVAGYRVLVDLERQLDEEDVSTLRRVLARFDDGVRPPGHLPPEA